MGAWIGRDDRRAVEVGAPQRPKSRGLQGKIHQAVVHHVNRLAVGAQGTINILKLRWVEDQGLYASGLE